MSIAGERGQETAHWQMHPTACRSLTGCGNLDWRDLGGMGKLLAIEPHFEVKACAGSEIMDGANGVVGGVVSGVRDAGWVSPEALKRDLHGMVDGLAEQIMGAVNGARKGQLINDSEEPVRVAGHEFIRAAFEAAIQQKIQAVRIRTLGVLLIFLTSPADRGGRNHRTPVIDIEETVCLSSRFTSGF